MNQGIDCKVLRYDDNAKKYYQHNYDIYRKFNMQKACQLKTMTIHYIKPFHSNRNANMILFRVVKLHMLSLNYN